MRRDDFAVLALLFAGALLLVSPVPADAHDIWLQAEQFTLPRGQILVVRQLLGEELGTDLAQLDGAAVDGVLDMALLRDMTPRFTLFTPEGPIDLLGEAVPALSSVKPVLRRRVDFDGLALVAMDHAALYTEFPSERFLEYLQHEALDGAVFRRHMGSRPVQSEAYERSLKVLVQVGDATGSTLHKQVSGSTIEILLLQNPYRLDPGDRLDVQVLFQGEPLAGQLVKAYNSDGKRPVTEHRSRTGADGVTRFKLDGGGLWLVRLVHLLPCSPRSTVDCQDADWESYWASYSFRLD